jgi:ribosomal-protein-alanine N-acetyltransferase
MDTSVKIRQFSSADAEWVKEIEDASIQYVTPVSKLSLYYKIIPEGFLVAEVDGNVVGYIVANLRERQGKEEGHILSIAVDPAHRRGGLGTELIKEIIKVFQDKGIRLLSLEVKTSNDDARRFYLNLGFEEAGILKRYYRGRGYTEDAVIMIKWI